MTPTRRFLLAGGAVGVLAGCAATAPTVSDPSPTPLKTERLVVQWETGIAASGFWTADGQILEQGQVPEVMSKFQGKQPHSRDGLEAVAYYEVKGYVVPLRYTDDSDGKVHRILHVVSVERMELARRDLPPFVKPRS